MIASIGGNDFKDAIERALASVASDKVLRGVNWEGIKRKDKQKRGSKKMVIIQSILGNHYKFSPKLSLFKCGEEF